MNQELNFLSKHHSGLTPITSCPTLLSELQLLRVQTSSEGRPRAVVAAQLSRDQIRLTRTGRPVIITRNDSE